MSISLWKNLNSGYAANVPSSAPTASTTKDSYQRPKIESGFLDARIPRPNPRERDAFFQQQSLDKKWSKGQDLRRQVLLRAAKHSDRVTQSAPVKVESKEEEFLPLLPAAAKKKALIGPRVERKTPSPKPKNSKATRKAKGAKLVPAGAKAGNVSKAEAPPTESAIELLPKANTGGKRKGKKKSRRSADGGPPRELERLGTANTVSTEMSIATEISGGDFYEDDFEEEEAEEQYYTGRGG
ncbi:hypothetical protein CYMTET_52223 [Cymbomonas tetramitiformis]|uniref:Uncharacterized protein n=1 Tax=Cymbomonas tetramitiformis TaxID=36881 RepID=A0AAE0BJN1_9CHLO|nr:hypothetical protein CYMTET_52223 [Cymbomonas tetramitiformis]